MSDVTLYFGQYEELLDAVNALAVEENVKVVRRAAGQEEIVFKDNAVIQFRTKNKRQAEDEIERRMLDQIEVLEGTVERARSTLARAHRELLEHYAKRGK